jgi:MFS family permease
LDALAAFRDRDFRVLLATTALLTIPLASFFPFAPQQLREAGSQAPAGVMALGQVVESLSMVALGWMLARWRLKWMFALGLACAVLRFVLLSLGGWAGNMPTLMVAVALHGLVFSFFFVTAQVFLEQRVDRTLRARAQALFSTASGGVGALLGALASGWWHRTCMAMEAPPGTRWAWFWGVLAALTAVLLAAFLATYRGRVRTP